MDDCFSVKKLVYNSVSGSATFETVWLYDLLLRLIPIQKIIPELFSHTWAAILADSSNVSPQSKFFEFMKLEWPFQFTAVTKIFSICTSFVFKYTSMYIYMYLYTYLACMPACIERLFRISALVFPGSVPVQFMETLAKVRKQQEYFIFTQLIYWGMALRACSYLNTCCKGSD